MHAPGVYYFLVQWVSKNVNTYEYLLQISLILYINSYKYFLWLDSDTSLLGNKQSQFIPIHCCWMSTG